LTIILADSVLPTLHFFACREKFEGHEKHKNHKVDRANQVRLFSLRLFAFLWLIACRG
jgi:hypothetical protein